MKRSFLENLGLEKETIDKVMVAYGKSITKLRTTNSSLKKQVIFFQKNEAQKNEYIKSLESCLEKSIYIQKQGITLHADFEKKHTQYLQQIEQYQAESALIDINQLEEAIQIMKLNKNNNK